MKEERTIVIDIVLTGRLVLVLSCVLTVAALLAYLALTGKSAAAAGRGASGEMPLAQSSGMRQFYLTLLAEPGADAPTACAQGYHFASLWELTDPSNLKYNTSLGLTLADSGQGPPQWIGWVRTGYAANTSGAAGRANCDGWTSSDALDYGTFATLPADWTGGVQDMGVWNVSTSICSGIRQVWCIEN